MKAELIAVGSELLHFGRRDTNSDWLAERLLRLGVRVGSRVLVDDEEEHIASVVVAALSRANLVLVSGGLGPTQDDRTREGLARALGVPLERDPSMVSLLESSFRQRGWGFSERKARMAERPEGSRWIVNPIGGAPGIAMEVSGRQLFALPGVPAELKAMFVDGVASLVRPSDEKHVLSRRVLKVSGRTESSVDEVVGDLYHAPGVTITLLARPASIEILLLGEGASAEESRERLDELDRELATRLGPDLFGRDDETLPMVVGAHLREAGKTLATAESCTAGLVAAAITEVPGSSEWYRGGLVVYSNDLKTELAKVGGRTLDEHGAVSAAVARELGRGARMRCGADLGVGITGVAGPSSESPEKPVGLVHVAVDDEVGGVERRLLLSGDRDLIRRRSVAAALDLIRRRLRGYV